MDRNVARERLKTWSMQKVNVGEVQQRKTASSSDERRRSKERQQTEEQALVEQEEVKSAQDESIRWENDSEFVIRGKDDGAETITSDEVFSTEELTARGRTTKENKHVDVGSRLLVFNVAEEEWREAEVLSIRNGSYYVHYLDYNKRLDEWVTIDNLDLNSIQSREIQPKTEPNRVKNFNLVQMGKHLLEPWYFSPYPKEFCDKVIICEFCLSYFGSDVQQSRHRLKCMLRHPPGNEIYRKDDLSFFEIDGKRQKTYCRNLCLLSKCFLDHKTLYYDVDPFMFYILTSVDSSGHKMVGYFSKEKESMESYNVACILTLPQYQRKGYGRLLIQFSYELSKIEKRVGSPEKPLSDLGLLSYRAYWTEIIVENLINIQEITLDELSLKTSITVTDVLHTLQALNALCYLKGQHIICLNQKTVENYHKTINRPQRVVIDPSCIDWKPPKFP